MIKHITVEIEDTNGISFKSMWCHPKSRTRMGKMPQDPMEWFKELLHRHGYSLPEKDSKNDG